MPRIQIVSYASLAVGSVLFLRENAKLLSTQHIYACQLACLFSRDNEK
jgi:hypothetical protein